MSAEEICKELGFTPEEAQEAHDRVLEQLQTMENIKEQRTAQKITNNTSVFLNQLVVDGDDDHWVVTDLYNHAIELASVSIDEDGEMSWGDRELFTTGDIAMYFEPQFESVDGARIPVWGY